MISPVVGRVTLVGMILLLVTHSPANARPLFSPVVGRPAPPFLLQDRHGNFHRLVDYSGKIVIVNFWASWCAPCREELPALNGIWHELRGDAVAMLAINVSDDRESITAFLEDHPIDFEVLLDSHGLVSRRWQVTGLPTTYVLDSGGQIIRRLVGTRDWEEIDLLQLVRSLKRVE